MRERFITQIEEVNIPNKDLIIDTVDSFKPVFNELIKAHYGKVALIEAADDSNRLKEFIKLFTEFSIDVETKLHDHYLTLVLDDENKEPSLAFVINSDDILKLFVEYQKTEKMNPEYWNEFNKIVLTALDLSNTGLLLIYIYTLDIIGLNEGDKEEIPKFIKSYTGQLLDIVTTFTQRVKEKPHLYKDKAILEVEIHRAMGEMLEDMDVPLTPDLDTFTTGLVESLMVAYTPDVESPDVFMDYIANSSLKTLSISVRVMCSLFISIVKHAEC